jgi:hypothetical protein
MHEAHSTQIIVLLGGNGFIHGLLQNVIGFLIVNS